MHLIWGGKKTRSKTSQITSSIRFVCVSSYMYTYECVDFCRTGGGERERNTIGKWIIWHFSFSNWKSLTPKPINSFCRLFCRSFFSSSLFLGACAYRLNWDHPHVNTHTQKHICSMLNAGYEGELKKWMKEAAEHQKSGLHIDFRNHTQS